uniref:LysM domain-containing protein n=1 Tax=Fagus sylvatica TaxID=28930 RepID=A0A2N9FUR8_FAGSY
MREGEFELAQPTTAATLSLATTGFKCTTTKATCHSLIDYVSPNTTTISTILSLFQIKRFRDLLGANGLSNSTSPNETLKAKQRIRIPFPCLCENGTGISNRSPNYTVKKGDFLYHIAAEIFSGLTTYETVALVNNISDPNKIDVGQKLWIPLPCSCDEVAGAKVVHYGHVVEAGSSVEKDSYDIWDYRGYPVETQRDALPSLAKEPWVWVWLWWLFWSRRGGGAVGVGVVVVVVLVSAWWWSRGCGCGCGGCFGLGVVVDVGVACTSSVNSSSLDYPLLVSNGTYVYTANSCVKCNCDSANNYTSWSTCPAVRCGGTNNLNLGDVATSTTCNKTFCAYAGYTKNTIFTTLSTESTCPAGAPAPSPSGTPGSNASPGTPGSDASKIGSQGLRLNFLFISIQLIFLCFHLSQ